MTEAMKSVSNLDQVFEGASQTADPQVIDAARRVARSRHDLMSELRSLLEQIDISDKRNWRVVILSAREAGVTNEELLEELGASTTTLHRWLKEGIAPREGTRKLMKRALLELVSEKLEAKCPWEGPGL